MNEIGSSDVHTHLYISLYVCSNVHLHFKWKKERELCDHRLLFFSFILCVCMHINTYFLNRKYHCFHWIGMRCKFDLYSFVIYGFFIEIYWRRALFAKIYTFMYARAWVYSHFLEGFFLDMMRIFWIFFFEKLIQFLFYSKIWAA